MRGQLAETGLFKHCYFSKKIWHGTHLRISPNRPEPSSLAETLKWRILECQGKSAPVCWRSCWVKMCGHHWARYGCSSRLQHISPRCVRTCPRTFVWVLSVELVGNRN